MYGIGSVYSQDYQLIMVIMNKVMNFYTHTYLRANTQNPSKSLNISNSSEALPSSFRVFRAVNFNFLIHFV